MAFSVSWDAYQNNICNGLSVLQQRGQLVDMTLGADGHHVKVHQLVMCLVSPYISDLINSAACSHPVIFLNQVSYHTLQSILQYAYTGEVLVARDKISEFLEACRALHIKGVEDLTTTGPEHQDIVDDLSDCLMDSVTDTKDPNLQNTGVIKKPENYENIDSDNDDTMDSFEDDHTPYHCGGSSPTPPKSKTRSSNPKVISDNLQYTVSVKGSLQLVCNRYLYFLMSSRKSGERMWRCMTYKRKCTCRAFLVTKDNKIIKRVGAHTHPYHDAQILKRLNSGNMFSALNEVESHVEGLKNKPSGSTTQTTSNLASVIITHDKNGGHMPHLI